MTITIVMTFEFNFYVLPTEVLIMAISIFFYFRSHGIKTQQSQNVEARRRELC
jgi:hypothetical protein